MRLMHLVMGIKNHRAAVSQYRRHRITKSELLAEVADVIIMCTQVSMALWLNEVKTAIQEKLPKLRSLV